MPLPAKTASFSPPVVKLAALWRNFRLIVGEKEQQNIG
jgi:hypothetical protein